MWFKNVLIATWNAGPYVFGGHIILGILLILTKKAEPRIDQFIKRRFKNPKKVEKVSDFIIRIASAYGWFMIIKNSLLFIAWLLIYWAPKAYEWMLPHWQQLRDEFLQGLPSQFPGM